MHRILFLLAATAALCPAQVRAVLEGAGIRVEASGDRGTLRERLFAKAGHSWVELASRDGGPVESISADANSLTEELTAGGVHMRRTLQLAGRDHWLRATTRLDRGLPVNLHAFADTVRARFEPDWSYAPSVGGFVPDAQYKAPLILVQADRRAVGIVPDVAALTRAVLERTHHALDLDVPAGPLLSVGFIPGRQAYHSVYQQDYDRIWAVEQPIENSYFIYLAADAAPHEAYREAVRFHWEQFARRQMEDAAGEQTGTDPRFQRCGLWNDWRRAIWDEESTREWLSFPLPDGSTGGAVGMLRWGEPRPSVYLGAWFNSLRTSYGMALYARRTGSQKLLDLAGETVRMALQAPGKDGAFRCIAVPRGEGGAVDWAAGDGSGGSTVHGYLGFDMSWTAYWLLRWRAAGLPGSDAIPDRCARLASFLIARQEPDGMLPTRFDDEGAVQQAQSRMVQAETAPVLLFLLELYKASPKPEYLAAARKGFAFLEGDVIPARKWYDFETFWSCSPRLAAFDARTRQWPANNLALIHAVAAYLAASEVTHQRADLDRGEALLDYLLLYQQSWTNPLLDGLTGPAMLLGGFTTQNSDAEWSDARQSLAGTVLIDYYRATGKVEYLERGVEALRAQFPISPSENWAHSGWGKKAGVSSFHWGTGSGMAGVEIEDEYLRDAVFDVAAKRGVGFNGLNVTNPEVEGGRIRFQLDSPFAWKGETVVVFRHADPHQTYRLSVNGVERGSFTASELERGVAAGMPARSRQPIPR